MAIELRERFPCPPAALWKIVGDVARTDWVAGVSDCVLDGDVRRMTMSGAGEVAERILERDAERRYVEYTVIESTPPLEQHLASMEVLAEGGSSCLVWRTQARPEAVEVFIEATMRQCLSRLHEIVGES